MQRPAAPRRHSPLDSLRSALAFGARGARRVIQPVADGLAGDLSGSAGGLFQESFVRRLERLNLLMRGRVPEGVAGEHRSRRYASSAEFADFRRYVPGDDFRRIDWNAYARLDGLFLKLTEATVEIPVHVLVDCSRSMNWGTPNKLGFARRLGAAIGYLALARFDALSTACFADELYERLPVIRGKAQASRLLDYLDQAPIGTATRLERAMAAYCATAPRSGLAFLISDLLTEDNWQGGVLQLLRNGLNVVVVHVLAPAELNPMHFGEIELLDSETGDVVELVVGNEARRTYQERVRTWCAEVESFCQRSEVGHLQLVTTMELEEIFLNRMRHRRIVR
jgi:uncharacterized protein (DUF58 family)